MNFSDQAPDGLNISVNWQKLIKVFDELTLYKNKEFHKLQRFYRPPLLTNLNYLRKLVFELGYPKVPTDFPKEILDAMRLNAENVMALKGSRMGLPYWLWVMTFGNISVDDSNFYPHSDYIILSDEERGYVSHTPENDADFDPPLYLFSDAANFGNQELIINIETKYYNLASLEEYLNTHIKEFIHFVDANAVITITLSPGVYTPYDKPYQYFVTQ